MNAPRYDWAVRAVSVACCLGFLLAARPGLTDPGQEPVMTESEPEIGVLALLGGDGDSALQSLAGQVQAALASQPEAAVLPVNTLIERLSGGGRADRSGADLERLRGLFQQGYLQSYSFEYEKALTSLHRVMEGLDRLAPGEARWKLWIKTKIFQGIALAGLKDEPAAMRAFAAVLRVRPDYTLSRNEYAPRTIQLFERARARLAGLPRGRLAVETEPAGARVELDGQPLGVTPFIGELPHGSYHLQLVHPESGQASRWVSIGPRPTRIRLQLMFEGALVLDGDHPGVRLPAGQRQLPAHWWPWLGARLGLTRLVVVRRDSQAGQARLVAALVDLERGRKLREGWIEPRGAEPDPRRQDARDLAGFVLTGRAPPHLTVQSLASQASESLVPPIGSRVPDLPVHFAPRPWYRTWWPYAAAGGIFLAGGLAAHLASDHYDRQSRELTTDAALSRAKELEQTWFGLAISGYVLTGAAVATGVLLHFTYEPQEVFPGVEFVPTACAGGGGMLLVGRF